MSSPETPMSTVPELSRTLLSRHVTMISIGGIIGAGLFVGSSAAIAAVGPVVILSYLLAGLVVLMVMRMLSEMAVATPGLGSFTEYIRLGLGNWAGFCSGWLYWYFWVVVVAVEALAGAALLHQWIVLPQWQLGLLLMLALTVVNLMSSRSFGEFEFWFSSIKVSAIVVFILIAGAYALGLTSPAGPTFANLYSHGGFAPMGWLAVLAGMTTVIFSVCGAEIATIAAVESNESRGAIARLTSTIIVRILLFYVFSVLLIVSVVPWTEIHPGSSPFALALIRTRIPAAATLMNLIVLTAVLSCLNSGVYVTSRVLFTLAAKGDAPQALVALSRRRVPARAILIGSSFGYFAVVLSIVSPEKVFAFLVNASGALMVIVYLLACWAHLRLRRRIERDAPERLAVKVWLFPWLSWLTIAAMVGVLGAMAFTPSLASQFYASLVCVLVVAMMYGMRRMGMLSRPRVSVGAISVSIIGACSQVRAETPVPLPVLEAETNDVATLPPAGPHRVFVLSSNAGGANVVDADSKDLSVLGLIPANRGSFMALSRDASRIFVTETFYSRGNRGTREDVLAIYDGQTLDLLKEVTLPGRLQVVQKPQTFDISEDGRLAYVYDMVPASSVHVVDLQQGSMLTSVDLPGCALAFPYGPRAFATVCGDGTIGTVQVPETGPGKAKFSKPFFDANADPLFESSVIDKSTGAAWFMTFSGKLFPATLGEVPVVGKTWSISVAAGLPPVGTGVQELAWRPGGGGQILALHSASKRLFVLMHTGTYWSHKQPGTEVWVLDAAHQALIRRIRLEMPARGIAVSQDAAPLLYVMGEDEDFAVLDATTGEKLRKRKLPSGFAWVPQP
jgi:GABA permease